MLGGIPEGYEHVWNRLISPHIVDFPQSRFVQRPIEIFVVNHEDIFTVNPALFIWIDMGYQQLRELTTDPRLIKYVNHEIFNNPLLEFKNSTKKYSHILMISNILENRNLMSKEMLNLRVENLTKLVPTIQQMFVGDPQ